MSTPVTCPLLIRPRVDSAYYKVDNSHLKSYGCAANMSNNFSNFDK